MSPDPSDDSYVPVSFFGMAVGTLAWGYAWRVASELWPLPAWLALWAAGLGLALWLGLMLAYARKWHRQTHCAMWELEHPVMSAMLALGPVSTLLAAITIKPWWPGPAWVLYLLGVVAQLFIGLWWVGRMWQGGRSPDSLHAGIYLPSVAQNFVTATASASFGHMALGGLFFGAGVFSWLALESLVLQRAATQAALPVAQRPLQGIQIAPAVVGGLSYLSLTDGPPDLLAHMLLGYGLYQAMLALRLLRWTAEGGFAPTYWAFSFGMMALAAMTLRMLQRAPGEALWQLLAPLLFALANLVMMALLWRTAALAWRGRLLPAPTTCEATPVPSPNLKERP